MFYFCEKMKYINVNSFNTSLVENMYKMLECCHALISLNLPNFDISHATNITNMFEQLTNLDYINIFNFKTYLSHSDLFNRSKNIFHFV